MRFHEADGGALCLRALQLQKPFHSNRSCEELQKVWIPSSSRSTNDMPHSASGYGSEVNPGAAPFPRFGLGWRTWRTWRARREAGAPLLVPFVRRCPKENTTRPLSIWGSGGGRGFSKAKPIVFGPPFLILFLGDPKNWFGVEITGPPLAHET